MNLIEKIKGWFSGKKTEEQAPAEPVKPERIKKNCKKCGKTFHMGMLTADALVGRVAREESFRIDREETVIYGICRSCWRGEMPQS